MHSHRWFTIVNHREPQMKVGHRGGLPIPPNGEEGQGEGNFLESHYFHSPEEGQVQECIEQRDNSHKEEYNDRGKGMDDTMAVPRRCLHLHVSPAHLHIEDGLEKFSVITGECSAEIV